MSLDRKSFHLLQQKPGRFWLSQFLYKVNHMTCAMLNIQRDADSTAALCGLPALTASDSIINLWSLTVWVQV